MAAERRRGTPVIFAINQGYGRLRRESKDCNVSKIIRRCYPMDGDLLRDELLGGKSPRDSRPVQSPSGRTH